MPQELHAPEGTFQGEPRDQYPANLDYIDAVSEYIPEYEELLDRVGRTRCSEDENYTETLQLGKATRSEELGHNEQQDVENCACLEEALVSLHVIPIATGEGNQKKMSATPADLKACLYGFEVSPVVLRLVMDGDDLGTKTQFSNGQKIRTETWFTLPFPLSKDEELFNEPRTVVWFDSREKNSETRFLFLMTSEKLTAKIRHLEESSKGRCILGYEVIAFLLESTLAEWSSIYNFSQLVHSLQGLTAYTSDRTASSILSHLSQVDKAILETMKNVTSLECILASIDFFQSHKWDLQNPSGSFHKVIFLEKLQEQKQRTQMVISKMNTCKVNLQNIKSSISSSIAFSKFTRSFQDEMPKITKSLESSEATVASLSVIAKDSMKTGQILVLTMVPGLFWNIAHTTYIPLWTLIRRRSYKSSIMLMTFAGAGLFVFRHSIYHGSLSLKKWVFGRFVRQPEQDIPTDQETDIHQRGSDLRYNSQSTNENSEEEILREALRVLRQQQVNDEREG